MIKIVNNKGLSTLAALIVLGLVLLILGTTAYFGVRYYVKNEQSRTGLKALKLKPELLQFSHSRIREVYTQIVRIDDVILLLDNEIKRLQKIGKQFPDQKPIVEAEWAALKAQREELVQALSAVIKEIEAVYVAYLVNETNGLLQIDRKRSSMKIQTDKALAQVGNLIMRLEAGKHQSPLDIIKDMIR